MNLSPIRRFSHPLNILLILSGLGASLWVSDVRPLAVSLLAEALWLAFGARWLEPSAVPLAEFSVDEQEQAQVRALTEGYRRRFLGLDQIRHEIKSVVADQPLAQDVGLDRELAKVDQLLQAWLSLAVRLSRRAQLDERTEQTHSSLSSSEAELKKVEETLRSLRDRVLTWSEPTSLSEPLNALLLGMSAAERTLRDVVALEEPHLTSKKRVAPKKTQTTS